MIFYGGYLVGSPKRPWDENSWACSRIDILVGMPVASGHVTCPFCSLPPERIELERELAFTIRDGYPVSPGHTLVIPRRHCATYFDATPEEQAALWALVDETRRELDAHLDPRPDGYNVGFNAGEAAGQTVMHLHIHVIPRYTGDVENPRGGVRWVVPDKADY